MDRCLVINKKHKWLGELPSTWSIQPLNTITSLVSIKNHAHLELLSLYRDYGVITKKSRDDNHNRAGSDLSKYKLVSKGDLVINKMKAWQGSVGISNYDGIISPAYIICKVKPEIHSNYLNYLLRSNLYKHQYGKLSYGVRTNQWDIRYDDFKKLPVLLPPKPEQTTIANFLDYKLEKINRFISKKKQLIELLHEQKAAIINQAVTKGLDPNVKMKDSGIEWLGEIPEHWEIWKIKWLSPVKRGASPRPIENPIYFDENGNYAWVRIADVTASERYLETTIQTLSELGSTLSVKQEPGDIFLSIAGSVGKPIITKIRCCIHDGFVWFPKLSINKEFLYYIFKGGQAYKGLGKMGTQLNLNTETVGSIKIPLPIGEEMNQIVQFLDNELCQVDKVIKTVKKEITLVEEYKTALIAEAVTGKIDVRKWSKPLILNDEMMGHNLKSSNKENQN